MIPGRSPAAVATSALRKRALAAEYGITTDLPLALSGDEACIHG
jgi:hypothetical protein